MGDDDRLRVIFWSNGVLLPEFSSGAFIDIRELSQIFKQCDVRLFLNCTASIQHNFTRPMVHIQKIPIPTVNSDNIIIFPPLADASPNDRIVLVRIGTYRTNKEEFREFIVECLRKRFKKAERTIQKTYHTNRLNNLKCKNKYRHHRQSQTKKWKLFSYL